MKSSYYQQSQALAERSSAALKTVPKQAETIAALKAQLEALRGQLAESQAQEANTHQSLHQWRDAASSQFSALQLIPILIEKKLKAGMKPLEVLDHIHAHATRYTRDVIHTTLKP